MASVTFPIGLGGDGSTVTDDSNATTGLGNGGHRARFVPALNQTVAMANTAVNSASTATTQAASATASASSASTSATNANNSFLSIDTKYLGEKTGDPTVNNQGGALATGAEYWNSSTSTMRVYNGTSWQNSSALTDFASNTFRISDNTDSTKKVAFNTSGITTGTVRTLTIPNVNGTVITSGDTGTVTATLLANTAVTGGSYGSATQVGTFTVDAQGRLTAASNTSIQISESQVTNLTTDLGLKAPLASPTFTGTVTAPTVSLSSGNLSFTGTGQRITGDFSNASSANRVAFQSSVTNGNTSIAVIPNGTSGGSNSTYYGGSDISNASLISILNYTTGGYVGINSAKTGTGVTQPMRFQIDGTSALTIATSRAVTLDTSLTTPTVTTTAATGVSLTNDTSNLISFITAGLGAPTFTTRSVGTKIVLRPDLSASYVDVAIGVENGYMWHSISGGYKWYNGTTNIATLTGTGDLTTTGTVSGSSATGFRNKLINGDFQIWQAGTSFSNPTNSATAYCADQWLFYRSGFGTGITATQQQTQTASKGVRIQRTAGDTSTLAIYFSHVFETLDVVKLAGKTVTLQCKVKKGGNYSESSSLIGATAYYGTGTDGNLANGFIGSSVIGSTTPIITTSLQQITFTFTIPSNATQFTFSFSYGPTGTAGANDWFEITDVQLEEGSVATPFERRPYGLELSLCQRYYESSGSGLNGLLSSIASTTSVAQGFQFKVEKRIAPTTTLKSRNNTANNTSSINTGADTGTVTVNNISIYGVHSLQSASLFTTGVAYEYHYIANARL